MNEKMHYVIIINFGLLHKSLYLSWVKLFKLRQLFEFIIPTTTTTTTTTTGVITRAVAVAAAKNRAKPRFLAYLVSKMTKKRIKQVVLYV